MTELQKLFLFYTFIFFVIQWALFAAYWVVLIMVEREARIKHAKCKELVAAKRASEKERWQVAYALYDKRDQKENLPLVDAS